MTSSSEESKGSFKFVNVAETPAKKRKFSNSDDARSFEEAELKRGMKRREKLTKIIVERLKQPIEVFQNRELVPRKERLKRQMAKIHP